MAESLARQRSYVMEVKNRSWVLSTVCLTIFYFYRISRKYLVLILVRVAFFYSTELCVELSIILQEKGNEYVKMGRKHYSNAIDCYTRAINQKALSDTENM